MQEPDPNRFNDAITVIQENLERTVAQLHDTQSLLTHYETFYRKFRPLLDQLQTFNTNADSLTTTINTLSQSIQNLLTDSADIAHF